ncbi:Histidine triad nucleotide-binding protein 1, partial [Geodia barretti]
PVHLLVIPVEHFALLSEVESDLNVRLGLCLTHPKMAVAEGVAESGYRLVINQGRDGGQEVLHLHMHVMGGRRLGLPA